jgi:hypothetical protein
MQELNEDIYLVRSIEVCNNDGWKYIVSDINDAVGLDGVSIYYKEPDEDKHLKLALSTEEGIAIANAILELVQKLNAHE